MLEAGYFKICNEKYNITGVETNFMLHQPTGPVESKINQPVAKSTGPYS